MEILVCSISHSVAHYLIAADSIASVLAHEITEAITDPLPVEGSGAWWSFLSTPDGEYANENAGILCLDFTRLNIVR